MVLIGFILLLVVFLVTLKFGASDISLQDIMNSFLHFNADDFRLVTVRDIRLPRWVADIIVGASLAITGAIMQETTENPMADSGLMGISQGATLGVILIVAFYPEASRLDKMFISTAGAAIITLLIYLIAFFGKGKITSDRMVLSGIAISTLCSSIITSLVLKFGLMGQMLRYISGSSANVIWQDLWIAIPFFAVGLIIAIAISRSLTVMNLGDDVSQSLGANIRLIKTLATIVVLILSAVAVIMIPYFVKVTLGTDYRLVLPICAIYGALFVTTVDFLAKCIHPGLEFPIGLLITMIGVPFFIYFSRKETGVNNDF